MNQPESKVNPYAPPSAAVQDIHTGDIPEKASRGIRLGAVILDSIVAMLLVYAPLILLGGMGSILAAGQTNNPFAIFSGLAGIGALVGFVLLAGINYVFVKRNGQTIAKKIVGIKVVRSDGSPATVGRIFLARNLGFWVASIIPIVNIIVGLVDALMIFSERQQCLHDRVADTIVVKA